MSEPFDTKTECLDTAALKAGGPLHSDAVSVFMIASSDGRTGFGTVQLVPDFGEGQRALAELQAHIGILPPELRQRLFDISNFAAELIRFEVNPCGAGAVQMTVRAYPSDRLLLLLAAFRAGDVDFTAVEQIAHGLSPSLSLLHVSVEGGAGASGKDVSAPFVSRPQFSCGADMPRKGTEA